jgi:hypothetical protein
VLHLLTIFGRMLGNEAFIIKFLEGVLFARLEMYRIGCGVVAFLAMYRLPSLSSI